MNKQPVNPNLIPENITSRLYTIRNIANLAVMCPQEEAEVYILQDVFEHISDMAQSLIEEMEQKA